MPRPGGGQSKQTEESADRNGEMRGQRDRERGGGGAGEQDSESSGFYVIRAWCDSFISP